MSLTPLLALGTLFLLLGCRSNLDMTAFVASYHILLWLDVVSWKPVSSNEIERECIRGGREVGVGGVEGG